MTYSLSQIGLRDRMESRRISSLERIIEALSGYNRSQARNSLHVNKFQVLYVLYRGYGYVINLVSTRITVFNLRDHPTQDKEPVLGVIGQ